MMSALFWCLLQIHLAGAGFVVPVNGKIISITQKSILVRTLEGDIVLNPKELPMQRKSSFLYV